MLITALGWLITTYYCFTSGQLFFSFLKKFLKNSEIDGPDFFTSILGGLIFLTLILSVLRYFLPISFSVWLIISIPLLIFSFTRPGLFIASFKTAFSSNNRPKVFLKMILVLSLILLFLTALPPRHYDVSLYHAPFIRWLETFPLVPGLANLHYRFGYNSSWHLLSAFFGLNWLSFQTLHYLNGWIVWIFSLSCFAEIFKSNQPRIDRHFLFRLIFLFFIFTNSFFLVHLSSPITDFAVIILTWWLTKIFIFPIQQHQSKRLDQLIGFFLPIILFTIKLSAAPLLLISIMSFLQLSKVWPRQQIIKLLALGGLFLLIQAVSNLLISGYPFYPYEKIRPIRFDWTVPATIVRSDREWIWSWAITPNNELEEVKKHSALENYGYWLTRRLGKYDLVIFYLSLISVILTTSQWLKKVRKKKISSTDWILLVLVIGWFFWFLSAPDPRFGYGIIIGLIALTFAEYLPPINKTIALKIFYMVAGLAFLQQIILSEFGQTKLTQLLIVPGKFPKEPTTTIQHNGQVFFVPATMINGFSTDLTGYYDFPSTPFWQEGLKMRGHNLRNGFKTVPQP